MHSLESAVNPEHQVYTRETPDGLEVTAATYGLLFQTDHPYVVMKDADGNPWTELFLGSSFDTIEAPDETLTFLSPQTEQLEDEEGVRIRIGCESTTWSEKSLVAICRPDVLELRYELKGTGRLEDCHFFGGSYADTKDSGFFQSRAYFKGVFNPEPTASELRLMPVHQTSAIDVTGLSLPGREDWFATPAPYCFGLSKAAPQEIPTLENPQWLMMGVATPIEQQDFVGVHYQGGDRSFWLRLTYEGQTEVNGTFVSPSVLWHFSDNEYTGLQEYTERTGEMGFQSETQTVPAPPEWGKQLQFCGWGQQAEDSAVSPGTRAQDFAAQKFYDQWLSLLAEHKVHPGVITIDDKWQTNYGTNEVDAEKWPDLRQWIDERHALGQKVLLWLKAWDAEGLPADVCVRRSDGLPVTVDPSNPVYRTLLQEQIAQLLSSDGYNADGFKIDFTARTPSGRTLTRAGTAWGAHLLHDLLDTIYTQTKRVKPDSLVITHTPSPWFRDVTDMIRLNDINGANPVVEQMVHRQRVAKAVSQDWLIDTDNWPMPSRKAWREYLQIQPSLGVVACYFATHVAGEPLKRADYDRLSLLSPKALSA